MQTDNESLHPGLRHTLVCRRLPDFDADDWTAVSAAFKHTHSAPLRQYWLDTPQTEFLPTTTRVGWTGDSLWVYAVMSDRDIYNEAVADNAHTWSLGDVFEIFLRECGREPYAEYHITPDNITLQLHFPKLESLLEMKNDPDRTLEDFMLAKRSFDSWVEVDAQANYWRVLARVPAKNITGRDILKPGEQWRYSFCRYDYTRNGGKPVISSTSCHEQAGFHRHSEWGRLVFQSNPHTL